ncbi:hypothetical protein ACPA54_32435 [Uniformispora flossi]|uniref:hypothetical protein n=1 Tax=Uniformispora flossi TaxID=3390723 RepID=UPI003C2F2951
MDIKKLTRGDALAALAALLIFGFSFAPYFKKDEYKINAWGTDIAPVFSSVVLTAIIAAVLFILGGLMPNPRPVLGLTLRQWAIPLAVITPLNALWSLGGGGVGAADQLDVGIGAIFIVLAVFILAVAVVATDMVPALKAPLGIGGGAGAPQAGAYGQPGGQPGPYGAAPAPQPGAYGAPSSQPGAAFGGAPAAAPAGTDAFQPYWFSVPEQRQLVDANTNAPTGSLNPGVWYLAVAQHGQGLLVEVDGVRGVLWNVQGIQKS